LIEKSTLLSPHYEFYRLYDVVGNTFTYIRIPYEDFGLIGVIIFSYFWGMVGFFILKKYLDRFSLVRVYLSALIIYSFLLFQFFLLSFFVHPRYI